MQSWLHIPICFSFVMVRLGANNLTHLFMQALMNKGGSYKKLIGKKLMTFGVDGDFGLSC
jgi:hypothetical protein